MGRAGQAKTREARERRTLLEPLSLAIAVAPGQGSNPIALPSSVNERQSSQLRDKMQKKQKRDEKGRRKKAVRERGAKKTVGISVCGVECRAKLLLLGQQQRRRECACLLYLPHALSFLQTQLPPVHSKTHKVVSIQKERRGISFIPTKAHEPNIPKNLVDAENETETAEKKTMAFTRTAVLFAILAGAAAQVRAVFGGFWRTKQRGA